MAGSDFLEKLYSGFYDKNPHMLSYFTTDEKLDYMEYKTTGKIGNLGNRDDLTMYFHNNPQMKNAVDMFSDLVKGGKSNVSQALDSFSQALGIGGSTGGGGGGAAVGEKKN